MLMTLSLPRVRHAATIVAAASALALAHTPLAAQDASVQAFDAYVEKAVREHNPDVPVYIYEGAGHGFNNDSPERYNEEAADLARARTRELFENA